MKVFEFKHNPDIYESAAATISIHKTREGAEKALLNHKESRLKEFRAWIDGDNWTEEDVQNSMGIEHWSIVETEILD